MIRQLNEKRFHVAVMLLCLIGVLTVINPTYRATFLAEIDVTEGWVAYHVDSILKGQPLYPSPDQLITNNYPPLFYYMVAAVARFGGNVLFAGRAISFVGLLATTWALYLVSRQLGVRRLFSLVAAVAYLATMCRLFDNKVVVNEPQLAAHAVMMFGFYFFLKSRDANGRWLAGATALMVTAGFIKHILLAVPISTLLFLAWDDRKAALRFALFGTMFVLAGLGVCAVVYGPDFAFNLFGPRPYHWATGFKSLEDHHRLPIQIALWVWFALTVRGDRARLINLLCLVSLVESFILRGGDEVTRNAGFDFVIAINLALGVVLEHAGDLRMPPRLAPIDVRTAAVALVSVRLLFGHSAESFNVLYDRALAKWYHEAERITADEVARVARIPGPVFCDSPLICFLAGKPFTVDIPNLGIRISRGRVPCDAVDRQLAAGALTHFQTGVAMLRPLKMKPLTVASYHPLNPISCR